MAYDWNFSPFLESSPAFLRALVCTIEISAAASIAGALAGGWIAALASRDAITRRIFSGLFGAVRAVPILVLIFFFYYFPARDLGLEPPSAFLAAVLALSFAQTAQSYQLVLSAIAHVPFEHQLGLSGLGFTPFQVARHATLPWVLRESLPGHMALWIGNILQSSLASVIGVEETVFVAKLIAAETFRSLEAWVVVALLYLLLVLPLNAWQCRVERRFRAFRREGR